MKAIDVIRRKFAEQGIEVPADTVVVRSYAGWAMRANGAWSWSLYSPSDPRFNFGSQYPVGALAKCKHPWLIDPIERHTPDRSVYPCRDCQMQMGSPRDVREQR